jgi:diaminopimelate epimerase
MNIPFSKYSACGNDFILIDNRANLLSQHKTLMVKHLCHRTYGIGADGIILLEQSQLHDFKMRIYNSDGSEAEMCGNGARCLMKFLHEKGFPAETCSIETMEGHIRLTLLEKSVAVSMPPPFDIHWDLSLPFQGYPLPLTFLNTGVPHAIHFVENLLSDHWMEIAPAIRHHPFFAPKGTNVNFAAVDAQQKKVHVRTYERGVEQETAACGTGAVAAAIAAAKHFNLQGPLIVIPASQEPLEINFLMEKDRVMDVTLAGPAQKIFQGDFVLN